MDGIFNFGARSVIDQIAFMLNADLKRIHIFQTTTTKQSHSTSPYFSQNDQGRCIYISEL